VSIPSFSWNKATLTRRRAFVVTHWWLPRNVWALAATGVGGMGVQYLRSIFPHYLRVTHHFQWGDFGVMNSKMYLSFLFPVHLPIISLFSLYFTRGAKIARAVWWLSWTDWTTGVRFQGSHRLWATHLHLVQGQLSVWVLLMYLCLSHFMTSESTDFHETSYDHSETRCHPISVVLNSVPFCNTKMATVWTSDMDVML
jgi:hypothetical protein